MGVGEESKCCKPICNYIQAIHARRTSDQGKVAGKITETVGGGGSVISWRVLVLSPRTLTPPHLPLLPPLP